MKRVVGKNCDVRYTQKTEFYHYKR